MRIIAIVLAATSLIFPSVNFAGTVSKLNDKEINALVTFLVSKELLITSKDSQQVPLSYYIGNQSDIDKYFGDYICANNNSCAVVDSLYTHPYAILGQGLPPQQGGDQERIQAQAQIERSDMKYGADIYDAATWQIALALASKNGYLNKSTAQKLVANQLESITNISNRATDPSFRYGYLKPITNPKLAFTFRMIATNYHNKDPFYLGKYRNYITWNYDPNLLAKNDPKGNPPHYFEYVSTWSDWKPITGENAWAQLIGPLQAEYLLNSGKISTDSKALINAINSLYAFSAMQAGIGAFYYAPEGSQGNQGPIPVGEISVENNFSVLGGLQILKKVLQNTEQTPDVLKALEQVDIMLYGGTTVNGYHTVGLLSFIYNGAFDKKRGIFYTHGIAAIPSSTNDWEPDTSETSGAMAVDINTWGTSALGVETIDKWYGNGSALKMWQQVRNKGGYFNQGQLWGVGYTLNNNNGSNPENIMSAEWTAGAINTLHSLISYYDSKSIDTSDLRSDLERMQIGIRHLRNDQYLDANFDNATPKEYFVTIPESAGQAYLYASKRFAIPFGWYANTLASTTSNAWVLMNQLNFNPFQYEGKLSGENYSIPKKIDLSSKGTPHVEALPIAVSVKFNKGDLANITQLSLSYNLDGSESTWTPAASVDTEEGLANLPLGTKAISIAYYNNGWFAACQIIPATKICKDDSCSLLYTVATRWSVDGKDECDITD